MRGGTAEPERGPLAKVIGVQLHPGWQESGVPTCAMVTLRSLSGDTNVKGRPEGSTVPVKHIKLAARANFLYPLCGEIATLPGLSTRPGYWDHMMEGDEVIGLS